MRSSLHRLVFAAPYGVLAVYVVLWRMTEPDSRGFGTHEQLGFAPCGFREFFGGPCPTCGVTTSASHAARGELLAAWQTQPLGLVILLAALLGAICAPIAHARGVDLGRLVLQHGWTFWALTAFVTLASWLSVR